MKTDDLINLLSEDSARVRPLARIMRVALFTGVVLSVVFLLATIGIRSNITEAIGTIRVIFKIGVTFLFAVLAVRVVMRIGRPGEDMRSLIRPLVLPASMLLLAVALELFFTPSPTWEERAFGRYANYCLIFIPTLSIAPLAAFLMALREGAPENPTVAGAVAGLASAAIASSIYAWHCPDDSPLFVALWYGISTLFVVLAGSVLGRTVLRW